MLLREGGKVSKVCDSCPLFFCRIFSSTPSLPHAPLLPMQVLFLSKMCVCVCALKKYIGVWVVVGVGYIGIGSVHANLSVLQEQVSTLGIKISVNFNCLWMSLLYPMHEHYIASLTLYQITMLDKGLGTRDKMYCGPAESVEFQTLWYPMPCHKTGHASAALLGGANVNLSIVPDPYFISV